MLYCFRESVEFIKNCVIRLYIGVVKVNLFFDSFGILKNDNTEGRMSATVFLIIQ